MTTAQERNKQVLAVLANAEGPLSPLSIAWRVSKPWFMSCGYPAPNKISPVLKRIGAFRQARGKWLHPDKAKGGAA